VIKLIRLMLRDASVTRNRVHARARALTEQSNGAAVFSVQVSLRYVETYCAHAANCTVSGRTALQGRKESRESRVAKCSCECLVRAYGYH